MKQVKKIFNIWRAMHNRCENPKNKAYAYYGARGINVCEQWSGAEGFVKFLVDMASYKDGLTLEREDNNGNYEPSNCRWATRLEQAHNKSNNHNLTANGTTQTLAEWARDLGCTGGAITYRLRQGMSLDEVVMKPIPKRPNSRLTDEQVLYARANYPEYTYQEIATHLMVSKKTIMNIVHGKIFKDLQGDVRTEPTPRKSGSLTDEQVKEIRTSSDTQQVLGDKFGVSRTLISMIISRNRYGNVM